MKLKNILKHEVVGDNGKQIAMECEDCIVLLIAQDEY